MSERNNFQRLTTFFKKQVKSQKGFCIYRSGKIYTPAQIKKTDRHSDTVVFQIEEVQSDGSINVYSQEWSEKLYQELVL